MSAHRNSASHSGQAIHPLMWRLSAFLLVVMLGSLSVYGARKAAAFAGVSLEIPSATVPPGGTLELQVNMTEPKPILKARQGMLFGGQFATLASPLGSIRSGAVFSPSGDASAVAVLASGSAQVYFNSPLTSLGENLDYPVMVLSMPVKTSATAGQTANLTLDINTAQWYDPDSNLYPVEVKSGVMTVGGTVSISDVVPGYGTVPAGSPIAIKGMGFNTDSKVDVNNANVASTAFVSSKEIDITLTTAISIEAVRIRVTQKNGERVTFYPYPKTTPVGVSTHALIASSLPLFAQTSWTRAFFKPVLDGSIFTGLAMQNLNSAGVTVRLDLYSSRGVLLGTNLVNLRPNARISRDLAEFFNGIVPSTGTTLRVTSTLAIQMMGLQGDDSAGSVTPVDPSATP